MGREPMTDRELEATLVELGALLDYPSPAPLAERVRARLGEPRRQRWGISRPPRAALLGVFATVTIVLALVLAVSPDARAAAETVLGLRGVTIFRVPAVATPATAPTTAGETPLATPVATPASTAAFPGTRLTLAEARARVGFPILVPSDVVLGEPDDVYVDAVAGGSRVTLVYRDRAALPVSREAGVSALVVEVRGRVEEGFFAKAAGPGTRIDPVTVDGARGFWLEGEPHLFFIRDAAGNVRDETLRLAGNTLLWERGDTTVRLEAQVARDVALRIASSFR